MKCRIYQFPLLFLFRCLNYLLLSLVYFWCVLFKSAWLFTLCHAIRMLWLIILVRLVITGKHQELAVFHVHGSRPPGSVHTFNTSVWCFPVITAPSVNTIIKQLQWNNCALALVTDNLKSLMHVIIFYFYSTASVGTRVNFKVYLRMTLKAEQLTTEQLKNVILGNVMKKSISSGEYTEKSYLKPDEVYVVGRKNATSEVGVNVAIGK